MDTSRETLYNIPKSHHSHRNSRPTLWLNTEGLTVQRHTKHCAGQGLIIDNYYRVSLFHHRACCYQYLLKPTHAQLVTY